MEQRLIDRVAAILNSDSLTVVPVGNQANAKRGILEAAHAVGGNLAHAVMKGIGAAALVSALGVGANVAHAEGVGYDANVYGQRAGQVMQQGNAQSMVVVGVRDIQIEVAPKQNQNSAVQWGINGIGAAIGAALGNNMGNGNGKVVGRAVGALIGTGAGQMVNNAISGNGEMVQASELVLLDPVSKRKTVITQKGNDSFQIGDPVLVVQMGGTARVIPDVAKQVQAQANGATMGGPAVAGYAAPGVAPGQQPAVQSTAGVDGGLQAAVKATVKDAHLLGLEVDAQAVEQSLKTGQGPYRATYEGKVVAVDKECGLVYQSLGSGKGVVLPFEALDHVPKKDEMISVTFREGQGKVTALAAQQKMARSR